MAMLAPFGFRSDFEVNGVRDVDYFIPYSSLVVPLSLLSAYLLLSERRAKRQDSYHAETGLTDRVSA